MSKLVVDLPSDQAKLIDTTKRVQVYRNLHTGKFSVRQGTVKFHCNSISLNEGRFNVAPAGNAKVRREGKKNVHATVSGYLDQDGHTVFNYRWEVVYNPYKYRNFVFKHTEMPVLAACKVRLLYGQIFIV